MQAPRAFLPDAGADALALMPGLSSGLRDLIAGAAGSSPFLAGLIRRETAWLATAFDDPEAAAETVLDSVVLAEDGALASVLREAKRRLALLIALADLAGVWSLTEVTGWLTRLADVSCDTALRAEMKATLRRGKLPGLSDADMGVAGGYVVIAMGKMGAAELNYSSDIDIICLFDETRFDPKDYAVVRQEFVRITRRMTALLSDKTEDGYVFRTDLRLRPDPSVTPICIGLQAAQRYYESVGRTWERAAYIKARSAAGDIAAGRAFLKDMAPFVWRRHLDFAAIQDAHDIRLRIRDSKGTHGDVKVPGHDVKLGRGGIREIELFAQTRQLIAGGRDTSLRMSGTVSALAELARKGWIAEDTAQELTSHYAYLRMVEHRIQMVNDAQTHKVPASDEGIARVACLMDVDPPKLHQELLSRLNTVHQRTEGFFSPARLSEPPEVEIDDTITRRWRSYPAFRSDRAQRIFKRFQPDLMARLSRVAKPDEALAALDGFLAGLPAGVQLFSLFEANPQLLDLLIDVVGTSPALASYLARNASVFDAVIGGQFFSPWPGAKSLTTQLSAILGEEADYERQLDAARAWAKEWHFRVGVHHLRGLVPAHLAGAQYADLADAVIGALWPSVQAEFARRHGPAPGRGAAIVGMGSLGAQRLNALSDLDIIVIYDAQGIESSDGPRPLAARQYYARLTQAMITALTAPMAQGRLYEVDMRLRPSGNQGPVATSWTAFQHYQENQAWVWEHLALTRARVICGPQAFRDDIEAFRVNVLQSSRERQDTLQEVRNMRDRIASAKMPSGPWDIKTGPGRMLDIELLGQTAALLSGSRDRATADGLAAGVACGMMGPDEARQLDTAYQLMSATQMAMRLISGKVGDAQPSGEAAAQFLCRNSDLPDVNGLETALSEAYLRADTIITEAVSERGAT